MGNFLEVDDLSCDELKAVLDLASAPPGRVAGTLSGKGVALVFEKPSARTRSSTEMAVVALGGHPVYVQRQEVGIDERETAEDVARTLACYHSMICARVFDHGVLVRMADALAATSTDVPVVNLLSDLAHPCQALADLLTLRQNFGDPAGRTVAYVGDANNVWRSLSIAAAMSGVQVRTASPNGFGPDRDDVERVVRLGGEVDVTDDPGEAVAGADVVYTDVWTSMGQEEEAELRRKAFAGFTIDSELMERASPDAIFMHCLPAHRGEEVTSEVFEGSRSRVWQQAANRMHAMRGLLGSIAGAQPEKAARGSRRGERR
jgi:ornithine carbamoyltransferase